MKSSYKIMVYNHLLFLTEAQRYDLYACIQVETTGILIAAEINKNLKSKNISEIFYRYTIDCNSSISPIELHNQTIRIHIPAAGASLFDYYDDQMEINNDNPDIYDILNKDEGGRESLFYETYINDSYKKTKSYHKIEIKDEKQFDDTAFFLDFNSSLVS